MNHFELIAYICGATVTVLGAVAIITGAIVKKNSGEIKGACAAQFAGVQAKIENFSIGAKERSDRVLILETRYAEILSRISRLEETMDKNAVQTAWIYQYMNEQEKKNKRR